MLIHVVLCTQAQTGCSYCLQMHTHSQVYPVQKQLAAHSQTPQLRLLLVSHFTVCLFTCPSEVSPTHCQTVTFKAWSQMCCSTLIPQVSTWYPHSTALSSWGHKWLKAVAMQPKGLQLRWALSYCTIVLYFCFQSWFRVLVRV